MISFLWVLSSAGLACLASASSRFLFFFSTSVEVMAMKKSISNQQHVDHRRDLEFGIAVGIDAFALAGRV